VRTWPGRPGPGPAGPAPRPRTRPETATPRRRRTAGQTSRPRPDRQHRHPAPPMWRQDPPARRKLTALVVRETLAAAAGVAVAAAGAAGFAVAPPVCAKVGATPAEPKIPVTTRQIVAVFTSVLLFASSPGARFAKGERASPEPKSLYNLSLADIPQRKPPTQSPFAQLITTQIDTKVAPKKRTRGPKPSRSLQQRFKSG